MRKVIILVLVVFAVVSCDSNRVFDDYESTENNSWLRDNAVEFEVDVLDTIANNNIFINLRNNKEYEFRNLFLIAELTFPDGRSVVDTLEYEMTDKEGRFLGTGLTDVKENKLFYKENVRFHQKGLHILKVEHAMRKNNNIHGLDSLKGITDIGFRIESVTE